MLLFTIFLYPHFPIRHPRVSSPRFADTSFASRFFELFTLPASLKLNTQRRRAPSMYVSEGSNHVTATWKKDFIPLFVCLFLYFFCHPHFSFFSSYFFCYPHSFPSAFFCPHFTIRIRHPQISGPRFTDSPSHVYFYYFNLNLRVNSDWTWLCSQELKSSCKSCDLLIKWTHKPKIR